MKTPVLIGICVSVVCLCSSAGYFLFMNKGSEALSTKNQSSPVVFNSSSTAPKKAALRGVVVKPSPVHVPVIRKPVQDNIDLNIKDRNGNTPIQIATKMGDEKIVELLANAKSGTDLNLKDNNGLSPLLTAVILDKEKIAEVLLRKGADVNVKDKDGLSPLALALKKGRENLAMIVLNNANFKLEDWESKYMGCMAQNASQRLTDALTKRGILVNATWENVLEDAISKGDAKSTEMILKNCGGLSLKSDWTRTLQKVAENGFKNVLQVIVDDGIDINSKDFQSLTALHHTIGDENATKILLDAGADKNMKSKFGAAPLQYATLYGKKNTVRLLIDYGADLNAQNNDGETALHSAILRNYEEIVRLLVANGARQDILDNKNESPRDLAHKMHKLNMVAILDGRA